MQSIEPATIPYCPREGHAIDAIDAFVVRNSTEDGCDMPQNEASLRNRLLCLQFGRLPDYALFRAIDLDREDDACRIAWWYQAFGVDPSDPAPTFRCLGKFLGHTDRDRGGEKK